MSVPSNHISIPAFQTKKKIEPRLFIRFSSKQSVLWFDKSKARCKEEVALKRTKEASSQKQLPSPIIIHRASKESNQQIQSVVIHESFMAECKQCRIKLIAQELEQGICTFCEKVDQLKRGKHFQDFVLFVLDFKMGKVPSYNRATRLRRNQSIQTIQSVIVDKPTESQLKQSSIRLKNNAKYGFDSKSIKGSKKFNISRRQNSLTATQGLTSGGYFCNECGANPIEGRRFHCLNCSDFDMCEKCYFSVGHRHEMRTCGDSKENVLKQLQERALKQSQNLKSTLPLLTASIQKFQNTPKNLYTTFQLRKKGGQPK